MGAEVLLLVTGDTATGAAFERDVASRYPAHELRIAADSDAGLAVCRELAERGADVVLLIAAEQLPGGSGTAFLREARISHPDAGRVLVVGHADAEAAVLAVNEVGLDRCIVAPWTDAHADLYPVLDDLLADWAARTAAGTTLVRDVMQAAPATLSADADLSEAAALVAATRVPDLMVVDRDGALVGVLSEGDILRSSLPHLDDILAAGGTLRDAYQLFLRRARELSGKPITHLVISEPLVLHPGDHIAKAATVMIDRQIRLLPVVEDGRLVGTLSRADICRAVVEAA